MMKAGGDDKNASLRRQLEEVERGSEVFLRRIENALQEPYDYGSARHDYENLLRTLNDVEKSVEKRGASGVRSDTCTRSLEEFLAAAKKDKEVIVAQQKSMAAAAAAARKRLA